MAKIEGTQTIPAEWLDLYRGNLLDKHPDGIVRKRYPYRLPKMQEEGFGVHPKQIIQRARFKSALGEFAQIDAASRSRWYAAMPEYSSLLWYYNYFLLSAIMGDANSQQGGFGVIRSIQHLKFSLPTAGTTYAIPTAVDYQKAVIMAWGGGHSYSDAQVGDYPYAWAWNCFPVPKLLNSSQIEVDWSETPSAVGNVALIVIEYI